MTVVRTFHPEVRLKQIINEGVGVRAEAALERAELELQSIRENCVAAIDGKVERLIDLLSNGDREAFPAAYEISNEVFAEAGVFRIAELSAVAQSLCVLLSAHDPARVPLKAVSVHLDAMRALRKPEVADNLPLRKAVLAELRTLAAHFGDVERKAE